MSGYFGKDVFKLGFGLMRLPKNSDGSIDIPQVCKMVDMFIEAGGTYFDTAFVYDNGDSEKAAKAALVDRYPRDRYTLCTKVAGWLLDGGMSPQKQLEISLERTGAGYFDYYLLHAIQRSNIDKYNGHNVWDFVRQKKKEGLIKHWGFSFHADPALLEELLTTHPDVDFIQLQINYADWDNPGVASRSCYEIARRHNVPITVMEPVKGGSLANPIDEVKQIFRSADPDASPASWAIRYVASLDGILTVLSGMSNIAQMQDNLSYMRDFKPLSEAEQDVIKQVQAALDKDKSIPCTACHYCTDGCPVNIPIPEIFAVKNDEDKDKSWDNGKQKYDIATATHGKASDCLQCGQCESACPQHLPIIRLLEECRCFE